ncbi:alpha/beta fold hydrolase [Streptomyces sp. NPDC058665]|uniref:alpha/beta fold hydrolase n=1 Tax=Streptomyces sp. NPDC058665 TaxID=3346586 RepID=UPI00364AF831
MTTSRQGFRTYDGATLRYVDEGSGHPFVILPGLSSSVAKFSKQVSGLRDRYRVLALDPRGHGESDAPEAGYTYHGLARDLHEFLNHLGLDSIAVLGHSAGCKIILTYCEIYGTSRLSHVVFSDDAPCCIGDGAFTFSEAEQTLAALSGPDAVAYTRRFSDMFVTDNMDEFARQLFYDEMLKMPRWAHAKLIRWALFGDWWDAVKLVDVPTLTIAGRISKNPWQNMQRFHEAIPGSEIAIFEADEGGSHAMYWENPEKYNSVLDAFLSR